MFKNWWKTYIARKIVFNGKEIDLDELAIRLETLSDIGVSSFPLKERRMVALKDWERINRNIWNGSWSVGRKNNRKLGAIQILKYLLSEDAKITMKEDVL